MGFRAGGRLPFELIVLNTLLPLVGPSYPFRLLPKFSVQRVYESLSFQSIPFFFN